MRNFDYNSMYYQYKSNDRRVANGPRVLDGSSRNELRVHSDCCTSSRIDTLRAAGRLDEKAHDNSLTNLRSQAAPALYMPNYRGPSWIQR
jgi:hypothetical protein